MKKVLSRSLKWTNFFHNLKKEIPHSDYNIRIKRPEKVAEKNSMKLGYKKNLYQKMNPKEFVRFTKRELKGIEEKT